MHEALHVLSMHSGISEAGCRVANVGSNASIHSEDVAFQYWFNGPMDLPDAADPLSQLTMDCLDATTGTFVKFSSSCLAIMPMMGTQGYHQVLSVALAEIARDWSQLHTLWL